MEREHKIKIVRIIITVILLTAVTVLNHMVALPKWAQILAYAVPYLVMGYDIILEAFEGIREGEIFDEDFLMVIATVGAFVLGEYLEASAVMIFFQIGEMFEDIAVEKSRRSISKLMDIRPDYANIEREGEVVAVAPDTVKIGEEIIVKAGERVPIDGVVTEGVTTLDTAALTGESLPMDAAVGDSVLSGSINMTGLIKVKTTKEFGESTASKILKLVEESGEKKAKQENFTTKFAHYYTPAVCISALLLALCPPLIRLGVGLDGAWADWIKRALTFLVISCPCALVISIPLTFFAGIGGIGKKGVLVKGSSYIEALSKLKTVVLDKTGTVTMGVFQVIGLHHNKMEERKLLEYAALAESGSNHPIAKSICQALNEIPDKSRVSNIEEISGMGIVATIDGKEVAVGNEKLMAKLNLEHKDCHEGGTIVHIAVDGQYEGHILISDIIKPKAKNTIWQLERLGVGRTVMLTGDTEMAAAPVAKEIRVNEYYASLLPEDKVNIVERLLKDSSYALAFVGDGINDAPVLSRADVGIAMGAMGQDAAIEAADVVIMDDDIAKLPLAIKASKRCMRIVYENIVFAIGVKLACLLLGALGLANMWLAVFADVGVMVIAVINAMRALKVK